jgi:hypothetical protein
MASDDTQPGRRERGRNAAGEWSRKRIEQEIQALQRKQFHQRERMLVMQAGLNAIADALTGHPGLDYPEELKPISFLPGSRQDVLFLSFGGVKMGTGIPPAEFHASLSGRDVPGYFIKDFRQCWYQEGLLGLSSDIAGTEAVLRALIARHAPKHVVTLGVSAGGYAAILFGALLGVDRVVAFSPQTNVDEQVVRLYSGFDTPPPNQFLREGDRSSLKRVLRAQASLPEIRIYFGADHELDSSTAEGLKDFPGVILEPLTGVDTHSAIGALKRSGGLPAVLERLVTFED